MRLKRTATQGNAKAWSTPADGAGGAGKVRRCSSEARLDLLEPANGDGVVAVPQLRFEAGTLHFELRADDTRTLAPQDRQQWLLQHTGTAPEEDVRSSRMETSEHKEKLRPRL